jgi:membrane protease YdiL (CAAX protease family)
MTRPLTPLPGPDPTIGAWTALAIWAGAVATFLVVGITLGVSTFALATAQIVGLAGTTLVATRAVTGGWTALGLGAPRPRAAIGAVMIGATLWYPNLVVSLPVAHWLGGEQELTQFQARWLDDRALAELLVAYALIPGICEELVCRGLLARAFATRYRRWIGVVVSALAFSLLHVSVPRALPTFALGLVLGWICLASGSLWPAVIAHVLNNAVVLAIASGALGPVAETITAQPEIAFAVAVLLSGFGGFLVFRGGREGNVITAT